MKKILFTASTWSHLCNFHLPYMRAFREMGWEVHAACAGEKRDIPCADRSFALPLEKSMTSPGNFRAALLLRREIRKERYDVLSCHTALASCFARLAVMGLKNRPAVVNICHGYLFDDDTPLFRRLLLSAAEKFTAPVTDLLMTMNDYDDRLARKKKLGKKIVRIPGMGVDFGRLDPEPEAGRELRRELGFSEKNILLVYGAEFSKRKNQAMLIRAMRLLPRETVLLLPGEGTMRSECMALAEKLGVSERVVFPGHVPMGEWLSAADIAVSSSRSEGLPFHMMEAMYAGLPVAASRVKGHTDLITEGENGFLFSFNGEEECAEAVRKLLDGETRADMGRNAAESVKRYSLKQVFPQVMAAYETLSCLKTEK